MRGIEKEVLSKVTSGSSQLIPVPDFGRVTVYVRSNGAVSAGAVQVEECDSEFGATTFAAVGSPITAGTSDGAVVASHLAVGCYRYLRARVSTTVTGGTVTVTIVASE